MIVVAAQDLIAAMVDGDRVARVRAAGSGVHHRWLNKSVTVVQWGGRVETVAADFVQRIAWSVQMGEEGLHRAAH